MLAKHFIKPSLAILILSLMACESGDVYQSPIRASTPQSQVFIMRPSDPLTISQGVRIIIDGKFVNTLWQNEMIEFSAKKGTHVIKTSVGYNLALPNITGFNGAKSYQNSFKFNKDQHYFKVQFRPGWLAGHHIITQIDVNTMQTLKKNAQNSFDNIFKP